MKTTLDVLTEKLFDYSGTFPPESKTFEDAIEVAKNFESSLTRPSIVNASFVSEFSKIQGLSQLDSKLKIAILGSVIDSDDKKQLKECEALNKSKLNILSYECRVTKEALLMNSIFSVMKELTNSFSCLVVIEPDLSGHDWESILLRAIEVVSTYKNNVALKFRGTGPTGIGNDKISSVIFGAIDSSIHLKATGGMHHPILEKRYSNNLGFLNITAALFFCAHKKGKISKEEMLEILDESDSKAFCFTEAVFKWKNLTVDFNILEQFKKQIRFSIGSCSLHEPDTDLVRLYGI